VCATSLSSGTDGFLSDHYNPLTKKLALSEEVYGSLRSLPWALPATRLGMRQHANPLRADVATLGPGADRANPSGFQHRGLTA